jgi:PAS domain S-box-containing protein
MIDAADWFEILFRHNPMPMAVVSFPEDVFAEVNDAWLAALGYTRDEVIGKCIESLNIVSSFHRQQAHTEFERTGAIRNLELQVTARDGTIRAGLFTGEIVQSQGKKFFLSVLVDVTEQRRAAKALLLSEERYRGIFDESVAAIFVFDNEKHFVDTNQAGLDLLGYSREELLRLSIPDVDADPVVVLPVHGQLLSGGRLVNYEHDLRRKDGTVVTVLNNSRPLMDSSGNVMGMQSTLIDITERKRAERSIKESEVRYRALFDQAVDGIMLLSSDGKEVTVNDAFARMHGYDSAGEMESIRLLDLDTAVSAPFAEERVRRVALGEELSFEVEHYRKDGTTVPLSVNARRVDVAGTWYLQTIHRDISGQKRAERLQALSAEVLSILNDPQVLSDATRRILQAIKRDTGIEAVGIRLRRGNDYPYAVSDGFSDGFLDTENSIVERKPDGEFCLNEQGNVSLDCTCGLVVSGQTDSANPLFTPGGSAWTNDARPYLKVAADKDPRLNPRNRCIHDGYQSVALVPIRVGDEIIGLLQLNDRRKGCFTVEMIRYFEGLASSFGVALQRLKEEEEARENQHVLRSLFDSVPESLFMMNPEGNILAANATFAARFGMRVDECVGNSVFRLVPEQLVQVRRSWMDAVVRTKQPAVNEELWGERWLRHNYCPVFGADGEVARIVGLAVDITEQKKAESVLLERLELQKQFAAVAATVPGLICSFKLRPDGSACMPFATSAITEIHGLQPEDVRDDFSPLLARIHPEDREYLRQSIAESARTMKPWHCVFRAHNPQRGEIWVEGHSVPRLESDGSILWHGFVQDVTERKQAEEALAEEATRRRILIEGSRDGIVVLDRQGKVFEANQRFADMLGYTPEEIRHLHVWDWDRAWPPDRVLEAIRVLGPEGAHFETRHYRKDGSSFEVELSNSAAELGGQKLVFCVCHDISERKRAEEAVHQAEERYRNMVETTFDWIWEVDQTGRYSYASPKVQDLLGYRVEEVLGKTPFEFMPPEEAERVGVIFRELAEKRMPFSALENVNRHKDGHLVTLETSGVPVLGAGGELRGYRGMDRDITERKGLEEQYRQSQKLEAIGQLAGGVAHDFNNILAAIMMQLGLLEMKPFLDGETQQALRDLDAEARRAASLTRQLLMFSRRSVLAIKPLDLNDVIANLLKMLGRLIGEQIDLRFNGKAGLPSVEADAGMLEQILMNLVVNARDAMPRGGSVTISTAVAGFGDHDAAHNPARRPGRFVCVSVSDTGMGMDEATVKRIFEPFFTTKESGRGTGLGLATVHGIVAQHRGWVEVDSRLGAGTTFHVFLPALDAPATEAPPSRPAGPVRRGRETILVVEDDAKVRETIVHTLCGLGYRVHEAANGQEAMRLWQEHGSEVDLLLTDMVMPEGISGLELTEYLQKTKPGLKAILSSGYSAEIVHAGVPDKPGVTYLAKPYAVRTLADVVRQCLDGPGVTGNGPR